MSGRFTWVVVAALAIAAPVSGQRPGPGRDPGPDGPGRAGPRGEAPLEHAIDLALQRRDSLGLSDDQVRRLESLREEASRQAGAMRDRMERGRDGAREEMRAFMETLRTEREALRGRFEDVLTEDQQDRLRSLARDDRFRRGPGMRHSRGGPPGRGASRERDAMGPIGRAYARGFEEGLRAGLRAGRRGGPPGPERGR